MYLTQTEPELSIHICTAYQLSADAFYIQNGFDLFSAQVDKLSRKEGCNEFQKQI